MTALNYQFHKLVKVTLEEKQALTDGKNNKSPEIMDESANTPISFMITIILINQSKSTVQLE